MRIRFLLFQATRQLALAARDYEISLKIHPRIIGEIDKIVECTRLMAETLHFEYPEKVKNKVGLEALYANLLLGCVSKF